MNGCNRLICMLADNVNCSMFNIFCFRSYRRYAGGCIKHNSRQKWGRMRWSYESLRAAFVQLLLAADVNHRVVTACGLGMRVAFLTPWCRSLAIRWETEKSYGDFLSANHTAPARGRQQFWRPSVSNQGSAGENYDKVARASYEEGYLMPASSLTLYCFLVSMKNKKINAYNSIVHLSSSSISSITVQTVMYFKICQMCSYLKESQNHQDWKRPLRWSSPTTTVRQ